MDAIRCREAAELASARAVSAEEQLDLARRDVATFKAERDAARDEARRAEAATERSRDAAAAAAVDAATDAAAARTRADEAEASLQPERTIWDASRVLLRDASLDGDGHSSAAKVVPPSSRGVAATRLYIHVPRRRRDSSPYPRPAASPRLVSISTSVDAARTGFVSPSSGRQTARTGFVSRRARVDRQPERASSLAELWSNAGLDLGRKSARTRPRSAPSPRKVA